MDARPAIRSAINRLRQGGKVSAAIDGLKRALVDLDSHAGKTIIRVDETAHTATFHNPGSPSVCDTISAKVATTYVYPLLTKLGFELDIRREIPPSD